MNLQSSNRKENLSVTIKEIVGNGGFGNPFESDFMMT